MNLCTIMSATNDVDSESIIDMRKCTTFDYIYRSIIPSNNNKILLFVLIRSIDKHITVSRGTDITGKDTLVLPCSKSKNRIIIKQEEIEKRN